MKVVEIGDTAEVGPGPPLTSKCSLPTCVHLWPMCDLCVLLPQDDGDEAEMEDVAEGEDGAEVSHPLKPGAAEFIANHRICARDYRCALGCGRHLARLIHLRPINCPVGA